MSDRLTEDVTKLQGRFTALKAEVGKVLVGQDDMLHRLMLGLLAGGHVLLEGVPGLAKTLVVRTLADALDGVFSRIQFTPDMLPGDVVGTQIYNPREGSYTIKKGPVFGNFILADEINRAPAKVQSALLEAMQERQVTLGDQTLKLSDPFLVLATQNPIEQEGTYPLPEAQLDRFMLKIKVGYPTKDDEVKIIDRMAGAGAEPVATKMMTCDEILAARDVVRQIFVDDKVKRYAVDLVSATRDPKAAGIAALAPLIDNGASVRASIALVKVAKAQALMQGRSYISPHDVKTIAHDVLRHRVLCSYEAEAQGKTTDHVIAQILENVPVPDRVMLPAEIASAVKRIQFVTGRQVADVMAGAYLSVFKGRGMEFDEVRPYVPGDDIRTIDWNVTARTGEPHVKRFVEERELTVMLLVDVSASQDFGSGRRSKLEAAVELSALLALSAVENGDKVGMLLFHGAADLYIPPRKGGKHALRIVREVLARGQGVAEGPVKRAFVPPIVRKWLAKLQATRTDAARAQAPRRSTSIAAALELCRQVLPRRAVLFLISDFLDDNYLQVLRHANRKHDVVAALITDPREADMPPAGLITLEDAESGKTRLVDTRSATFRTELARRAQTRTKDLQDQLRSTGMDLVVFDAAGSMVDPLLKFFRERERRLRR